MRRFLRRSPTSYIFCSIRRRLPFPPLVPPILDGWHGMTQPYLYWSVTIPGTHHTTYTTLWMNLSWYYNIPYQDGMKQPYPYLQCFQILYPPYILPRPGSTYTTWFMNRLVATALDLYYRVGINLTLTFITLFTLVYGVLPSDMKPARITREGSQNNNQP